MKKNKMFLTLILSSVLINANANNLDNSTNIISPFYDSTFKHIFSPNTAQQKERLADFLNETLNKEIKGNMISPITQEAKLPIGNSSKGRLICDIPFLVTENGQKYIYCLEMQQVYQQDFTLRLLEYGINLMTTNDIKNVTVLGVYNEKSDETYETFLSMAKFRLKDGSFVARIDDVINIYTIPINYYKTNNTILNHDLPKNGWMSFFYDCNKSIENDQRFLLKIASPSQSKYKNIINKCIKLLDPNNKDNATFLIDAKRNEDLLNEMKAEEFKKGQQEGIKEGIIKAINLALQWGVDIGKIKEEYGDDYAEFIDTTVDELAPKTASGKRQYPSEQSKKLKKKKKVKTPQNEIEPSK